MSIAVRIVSDVPGLRRLREPWQALCDRAGAGVFSLPGWHIAWWSSMGLGSRMATLVAEEDGVLVGVLPLALHRSGPSEAYARVLECSGATQADVHDVVAETGRRGEVLGAFDDAFRELAAEVDLVRLTGIPDDSPLRAWAGGHARTSSSVSQALPVLTMGAGYEEMAGGWKKSHRNDVQRQARRLAERGTLTLACPAGPDTVRGHLAAFLAMHARTWRTKGQSLRKRNEELAGFFERLIDELWAESHFSMLCVDGDPVSYHFGFLHAGRFYWYKPAYDQAYENLSPGKVHIAKLIKLGAEQGWQAFDFLTGAEPYKYAWTGDERHTVDLSWRNPTLRSSVSGALGSARPGLGRLLRSIRRARAR